MRFDFHPDIVERAVFAVARRDAELECELHAAIDRLYEIADRELRQQAFNRAYGELFGRWRLDAVLSKTLQEFPLVERGVEKCAIAQAARGRTQAVDLFVRQADAPGDVSKRTLLIQLCPEAFLRPDRTSIWLRSELYQVSDMLDAEFGYAPEDLDGASWECKVRRDRYQVLWRSYVAGRLMRSGRADELELPALRAAFHRAFTYHGVKPTDDDFTRILNTSGLTHHQLLSWANRPQLVVHTANKQNHDTFGDSSAGRECPLCGFPTYDWYIFATEDDQRRVEAIKTMKPSWRRELGACRQCVETIASGIEKASVGATSFSTLGGGRICEQEQTPTAVPVA